MKKPRARRVNVIIDGKLRRAKVLDDKLPSLMGGGATYYWWKSTSISLPYRKTA